MGMGQQCQDRETRRSESRTYALMRHPLYAGNFLIILGVTVSFNNPWAYLLVLVPFAYLYHFITNGDERRMSERLGAAYKIYSQENLSRFLPEFRNLKRARCTTTPFNFLYAWRKEYNSICAWLAGVSSLAIYRDAVTYGWKQAWYRNPVFWGITAFCGALAIFLNVRDHIGRKEASSSEAVATIRSDRLRSYRGDSD